MSPAQHPSPQPMSARLFKAAALAARNGERGRKPADCLALIRRLCGTWEDRVAVVEGLKAEGVDRELAKAAETALNAYWRGVEADDAVQRHRWIGPLLELARSAERDAFSKSSAASAASGAQKCAAAGRPCGGDAAEGEPGLKDIADLWKNRRDIA